MNRSTLHAALLSVSLDRDAPESLQSQLIRTLRQLVHAGRLRPGDRLPSSRMLADELSVSRVTVSTAFEQLISEGYAEARRGSGVYIAADLPDFPQSDQSEPPPAAPSPALPQPIRAFETAAPDLRQFPHREWARLLDLSWRSPSPELLARPDPFGWAPLRAAIARHLNDWRGIRCDASQVVVTLAWWKPWS